MNVVSPRVNKTDLSELANSLGYAFKNPAHLERAVTHRSYAPINNERMEFLGDSILGMVIAEALFNKFTDAKEGQLSRMRSSLVRGDTLAELAKEFKVGDFLRLGEGERKSGGRRRSSILADCFEAIIAAIYFDSDFATVKTLILSWYTKRIENLSLDSIRKDPKSALQEWLQAKGYARPKYVLKGVQGKSHQQLFTVICQVEVLTESFEASGESRRQAEKIAAAEALARLQEKFQ